MRTYLRGYAPRRPVEELSAPLRAGIRSGPEGANGAGETSWAQERTRSPRGPYGYRTPSTEDCLVVTPECSAYGSRGRGCVARLQGAHASREASFSTGVRFWRPGR